MKGNVVFKLYLGYFYTLWVFGDFCFPPLKSKLDWKASLSK